MILHVSDRADGVEPSASNSARHGNVKSEGSPTVVWLFRIGTTLVMACMIFSVLSVPFVFSNDGPEHLYSAQLLAGGEGTRTMADGTELTVHHPLTANGFVVLVAALATRFDGLTSYRIGLVVLLLLQTIAALQLHRALGGARWAGPVVAALGFNYLFWFGFLNYLAAQAGALLLLAFAASVRRWTPLRVLGLSGGLALVGWMHLLPALLCGALLGVGILLDWRVKRPWRRLAMLAVASIPLWLMQLPVLLSADSLPLTESAWTVLGLSRIGTLTVGGPTWRWAAPVGIAATGIISCFVTKRDPRARGLAVIAMLLISCMFILPVSILNWEVFSPRIGLFGVFIAIGLVGAPRRQDLEVALVVAATCIALLMTGWGARLHSRAAEGCVEILRAADELAPPSGLQAFVATRTCTNSTSTRENDSLPGVSFVAHAGALLAAAQGGAHEGFYGHPWMHTYSLSTASPLLAQGPRNAQWSVIAGGLRGAQASGDPEQLAIAEAVIARSALLGASASRFVIFGFSDVLQPIVNYGFETTYRSGDLVGLEFSPQTEAVARLTVQDPAQQPFMVQVEYGWVPLTEPVAVLRVASHSDGTAAIQLPRAPRARIWLRIVASGPMGVAGCRGANSSNLLVVDMARSETAVVCTIDPAVPVANDR